MTSYCAAIPTEDYATALDALGQTVDGAMRLRAAVAFVTRSGVDLIEQICTEQPQLVVEVIARGAPITDPAALVRMADQGVSVSVVVGARAAQFHPKLWLVNRPEGLHVLAGSGNLTAGGLRDNLEQFELLHVPRSETAATVAQDARFERLTCDAVSLALVRDSAYWRLWNRQLEQRRERRALHHFKRLDSPVRPALRRGSACSSRRR